MKIALAQVNFIVGDFEENTKKIITEIDWARSNTVDLIVFSELAICGYPPEDLLLHKSFIHSCEKSLQKVIEASHDIAVVIGTPRRAESESEKPLFNSAAVIENGKLIGYQDKTLLPTYDVFDESRYFSSARNTAQLWTIKGCKIGVTICEDLWQHARGVSCTEYSTDPVKELSQAGADLVLNLSASPYSFDKLDIRFDVIRQAVQCLQCPVFFCNQIGANDSLIFDGHSFMMNQEGKIVAQCKGFEEDRLLCDLKNESPVEVDPHGLNKMEALHKALVLGLRDYFSKQGFTRSCLGLSGGIDSALVAYLAVEALGKDNVLAVAMPSRYSSEASFIDAEALVKNLGISLQTISIEEPFKAYLHALEPHFEGKDSDVTEENLQSRIRGMLLMALSNKHGYIVLATGNKSELATGYSTLYGDSCGGLAVIGDLPKTLVYRLAEWINRENEIIPKSTLEKPPSAELRPNQKDSDSLPNYSFIDHVLEAHIENHLSAEEIAEKYQYPLDEVQAMITRIHRNEYKRRQCPLSLRVSQKAFSKGRSIPIAQKWI
jgi:NAD+ synthase (glutamine-hydrolysing)